MSKVFIEEETLIGIGNAIREKSGTTDLIATTDMATAISNLPSGGGDIKMEYISYSNVHSGGSWREWDLTNYLSLPKFYCFMYYNNTYYSAVFENGTMLACYSCATNGKMFDSTVSSSPKATFSSPTLRLTGTRSSGANATIMWVE